MLERKKTYTKMQISNIYFFSIRGRYFAYDINTTFCCELDDIALTILPELVSGNKDDLKEKYADIYPKSQLQKCIRECKELFELGYFKLNYPEYKHPVQNNVSALCLHISHNCNLNCEYCYADAGAFGGKRQLMSRQVMLRAIDFAFNHSGKNKSINVGFFGGEPLLNFKLIREAVQSAKNIAKESGKNVSFSMTTNATLLTPDIMDFLKKENFSLLFSIDGPQKIHDRMRKTKNNKCTHSIVLKNVKEYMNHYSDEFTVRGTFTRTTPNFSEQVIYLNSQGFRSISVEPAQLDENNPHSISTQGEIARILFEYDKLAVIYLQKIIEGKPLHFFHFDYYLKKLLYPQPTHTECGAGCGYIAVAPDGRIFPCFETVPEKENCIGHIDSGFYKVKRRTFQSMHADVKTECRNCWIKYICGGGCHAFNIRYNNNIKIPYKPQCEFIKHRYMLSSWILAELLNEGEKTINVLKEHLIKK